VAASAARLAAATSALTTSLQPAASVPAHLWVEQPEGVAAALATAPGERDTLKPFFAAVKLFKYARAAQEHFRCAAHSMRARLGAPSSPP
jgi:hypothetical protein